MACFHLCGLHRVERETRRRVAKRFSQFLFGCLLPIAGIATKIKQHVTRAAILRANEVTLYNILHKAKLRNVIQRPNPPDELFPSVPTSISETEISSCSAGFAHVQAARFRSLFPFLQRVSA